MKKRFIFIPLAILIVIAGVLIWACELRHPFGMGLSAELLEGLGPYMSESGGPGYKGDISAQTTNTYITKSTKVMVFPLKEGNNYYRIPTLMQLTNGDLLAFADKRIGSIGDLPNKIEIVYKRSKNMGRNWSPEKLVSPKCTSTENSYGDAAFILDRKTGNIICVVASGPGFKQSTPNKPIRISIIISKNNGETWGTPVDITSQIYGSACKDPVRKTWYAAFTSSGNGVQLRNGRIMFVLNVRKSDKVSPLYNHVLYTDDGGATWNVSKGAPGISKNQSRGGSEAKIVELNDGTLLMAIRPEGIFQRFLAKSTDNGETWGEMEPRSELPSSSSNGDIIYYTSTLNGFDKNRIITMFDSRPWSGAGGGNPGNPKLYWSYDEGKTWEGRQMHSGEAGYSSLAILKDGSIGILAEIGGSWNGPIYFMRLNMKYITSGKDSGPFKVKVKQK